MRIRAAEKEVVVRGGGRWGGGGARMQRILPVGRFAAVLSHCSATFNFKPAHWNSATSIAMMQSDSGMASSGDTAWKRSGATPHSRFAFSASFLKY